MPPTAPATPPLRPRPPSPSAAGVAALLALGALVLGLVGLVGVLVAPGGGDVAAVAATVLLVGAGPALTSLGVVVLVRDVGLTTARGALQSAVAATVAWTLATLASLSWSVGFDQADAGLAPSPFAQAFGPLLGAAVLAGTVAWLPVVAGAVRTVRQVAVRRAAVVLCSLVGAVAVGAVSVTPGSVLGVATVLLVACGRLWLRGRDGTPAGAAPRPVVGDVPHRRLVLALAVAGGVLSLPPALYALLGDQEVAVPAWFPGAAAALPPMNVGLALGALTSLPLVVAAGVAATRWWGRRAVVMTVLVAAAVVLRGAGAASGPSGGTGTSLLVAGALLVGCAGALPLVGRAPGHAAVRWTLAVVVAAALAWVVGMPLLAVLPLAAPVLAVALVVVVTRRPALRRAARRP